MTMKSNGFTLVEVLIGLSIATVAAVSIAYTISSTNKVADAGKKTFIATNLAHEGLELTREKRDDAWLATGAPANHSDWADTVCGDLGGDINKSVTFGSDTTSFARKVEVKCNDKLSDPAFVEVTSKVDWTNPKGEPKTVEIKEKLYNWYVAPKP